MFKTSGFMNEEKAALAADAFEQATHSLVMKKAMENVKAENQPQLPQSDRATGVKINKTDLESQREQEESNVEDDDFDDDNELQRLREARLEQLKIQRKQAVESLQKGHGKYEEIVEEDFLKVVTGSKYSVVAFFHRDFERCRIVDKHLAIIAPKHLPCRFVKMDSEKAPFFVAKLQIRMLPTIVCFVDGVAVDRIVGFDELGARDDFSTIAMEQRLAEAKVIATSEEIEEFKKKKNQKKKIVQRRAMGW